MDILFEQLPGGKSKLFVLIRQPRVNSSLIINNVSELTRTKYVKMFMIQVTRLCDLTNENDTVTSVSWAERGDKVAVGTHRGFVQVRSLTTL